MKKKSVKNNTLVLMDPEFEKAEEAKLKTLQEQHLKMIELCLTKTIPLDEN